MGQRHPSGKLESMRTISLVIFVLFVGLLSGCAGGSLESKVPGKYKFKLDLSGMPKDQQKMMDMAKGMLDAARMELKADKTMAVTGMVGGDQSGTWKLEGDKITIAGKSGSPMVGTISADGKTITPTPDSDMAKQMQGAKITLIKE